jgi:hypothetical protein
MRRLLAIGFVWLACSGAWAILGSSLAFRSGAASGSLLPEVHALWGPPLVQAPPSAKGTETHRTRAKEQRFDEKERRYYEVERERDVTTERALPLESSDLDARLALEHRRKGLLWFPTYGVEFGGRYEFRNEGPTARKVEVTFPVEARGVTYDGFEVTDDAGAPIDVAFEDGKASFSRKVEGNGLLAFHVRYRTRGTERWSYGTSGGGLGSEEGLVRRFRLGVSTNFAAVDFPPGTLSPSEHGPAEGGWKGTWRFDRLVGSAPIGVVLPERLNPGPLASKITFFAPVSLLFFFFVTGVLLAARGRSIHPVNYFLLACAFFAFHLLFAYLLDHLAIGPAFAAASAVSLALVVSYARLFVGWRTAVLQLGASQLIYLVLFSFTFFWQGFTGLAITAGAILTLFVMMQITGRLDWAKVLARAPEGSAGAGP